MVDIHIVGFYHLETRTKTGKTLQEISVCQAYQTSANPIPVINY